MINKNINDINFEDIENLINTTSEGKQIEFKSKYPTLGKDSEKKEFLFDISSFANTIGGLLIYGIREDKGRAKEIAPIPKDIDFDKEQLKLENIIRAGIEPRIKPDIKIIKSKQGERVLIIKIPKSWSPPHRVIFKNSGKFYARNSAGKYELDTSELRSIFNLNKSLIDKAKDFRDNRLMKIISGELPVGFSEDSPKIVFHIIPIESFTLESKPDLEQLIEISPPIYPFYDKTKHDRRNLEGMLFFLHYGSGRPNSYIQVYKNGIIEIVNDSFFELARLNGARGKMINSQLEGKILKYYKEECARIFKNLDIGGPAVFAFSLINIEGFTISRNSSQPSSDEEMGEEIKEKNLILPEILINDLNKEPEKAFKEIFELIWNACNMKRPESI